MLFAAAKAYPSWLLAGLLPGILFIFWASAASSGLFLLACFVVGIGVAVIAGLSLMGVGFFLDVTRNIPANFFGLCTGMQSQPSAPPALTPWLGPYLNELAGRPAASVPLTFGDLWGSKDPLAERNINLEMMTTCLSHGRPYRLPFRDNDDVHENRQFYFDPEEFRQLFPDEVVQWMIDHPRSTSREPEREAEFRNAGYCPLPEPWDLPVVVAVRMSLSFPVLLSAVPLHAVDYGRKDEANRKLERCWFSDGGISSNFPVHFFDSPLPRWPTFAITLADKHPDYPATWYLPENNSARTEQWTRFETDASKPGETIPGVTQLHGFLSAILGAMQNWSDNTQGRLPGFRDRIGTISLNKSEGGLNLNMPPERIEALSRRGKDLASELVGRFATGTSASSLTWPNHRWVRLRSALAALEEALLKLDASCANPLGDDVAYDLWVQGASNDSLPSYPWKPLTKEASWEQQRGLARDLLAALRQSAQALGQIHDAQQPLSTGAPRPRAELRVRPRI
jgi:hypothetical protein